MMLNSFQLKCIAIITMLIDHIGAVLFPYEIGFRIIGRIAFPIFCFLIVEGFYHTRDVRRYMLRLGAFAIISEVPYDLAFQGNVLDTDKQNVFFTLALGVLMMYLLEAAGNIPVKILEVLLLMWLADFLGTDYGGRGLLLIFIYYIFYEKKLFKMCVGAGWNLLYWALYGSWQTQCYGVLATPFLALYNGERGRRIKYFFYVFYPVHLLVLYGLKIYFFSNV